MICKIILFWFPLLFSSMEPTNTCANCGVPTSNPRFCGRSCAAKKTNKESVKRKPSRKCAKDDCEDVVSNCRTSLCKYHLEEHKLSRISQDTTIEEFQNRPSVKGKHWSWANAHIRLLCRNQHKDLSTKPCANCGYEKHVELCHIKALSSFPGTATLHEVNHENNLIQLCRNCHWESHNGLISDNELRRVNAIQIAKEQVPVLVLE